MKVIKVVTKKIKEEICDAKDYAKLAIEYKHDYPQLATTLITLSNEEMKHMTMLHNEVVRLIDEYRKTNGEPPEPMLAVYNYLHEEQIEMAEEAKRYQAMYNEQ